MDATRGLRCGALRCGEVRCGAARCVSHPEVVVRSLVVFLSDVHVAV